MGAGEQNPGGSVHDGMNRTKSLSALGLGLALTLALSVHAQNSMGDGTPPAPTTATSSATAMPASPDEMDSGGKIHRGDKGFILAVAEGSNQEIALSQLAATNAARQDVKDFALMMIRDHGLLNAQLADLAGSKGVEIAEAVAKGGKKGVKGLGKKQGADFDEAYVKAMVKGHDTTLAAFKKESDMGKDADVQAFASRNLPTIQLHDDHAHRLADAAK
jgi:putative membrane protein